MKNEKSWIKSVWWLVAVQQIIKLIRKYKRKKLKSHVFIYWTRVCLLLIHHSEHKFPDESNRITSFCLGNIFLTILFLLIGISNHSRTNKTGSYPNLSFVVWNLIRLLWSIKMYVLAQVIIWLTLRFRKGKRVWKRKNTKTLVQLWHVLQEH